MNGTQNTCLTLASLDPPPGAPVITPTDQQGEAIARAVEWYHGGDSKVFRLFGYAGTGKTTLAKHIVAELGITQVIYAAYTGKAAYVLRTKGCAGARTIHSLIYRPKASALAELTELEDQLEKLDPRDPETPIERQRLMAKIEELRAKLAKPTFILREPDDCDLTEASLLVLDEASMVDATMARDLLSFGTKILVLGDPMQLPPISGYGYFTDARPDYLLTEIHRSALDSPVTRIATRIRYAQPGDALYGCPGPDGDSGRYGGLAISHLATFDQTLVWSNRMRWTLINRLRAYLGRPPGVPVPGDRVIVLANNKTLQVFNGQQLDVQAVKPNEQRPTEVLDLIALTDELTLVKLPVFAAGFVNRDGEQQVTERGRDGAVAAATFGQVVTVHKSQGSQWDRVLVAENLNGMLWAEYKRRQASAVTDAAARLEAYQHCQRWLYTAVTRAAQQVVIVPEGGVQ